MIHSSTFGEGSCPGSEAVPWSYKTQGGRSLPFPCCHFLDTRLKNHCLPLLNSTSRTRTSLEYLSTTSLHCVKTDSMSRNLSVIEPHPTVPKSGGYIYGGRGGAGNYRRYKGDEITSGPTASGPASRINLAKSFKRQPVQTIGRGGAGNMFKPPDAEERVFQFDEEMKRREVQSPVYHIGRGGAGNWAVERQEQQTRGERVNSTASDESSSSGDSTRRNESTLSKLARRFS